MSDIEQGLYQSLLNKHDFNFEKAETLHKNVAFNNNSSVARRGKA